MSRKLLALTAILLMTASTIVLASIQWQNISQNPQTTSNGNQKSFGYTQSQTDQSSTGSDKSPSVKISVYENSFPINETSAITQVRTIVTGDETQRNYTIKSSGILYPYNTTDNLNTRFLEDKNNATIIEKINWGDVSALPPHGGAQLTSNTRTLTIINDGKDAVTINIPTIIANFGDYDMSVYNYTLISEPTQILQPGQKAVIALFLHVATPYNSNPDPVPFSLNISIIATKVSK